jgi:exopolysaccharide production protein ExoY
MTMLDHSRVLAADSVDDVELLSPHVMPHPALTTRALGRRPLSQRTLGSRAVPAERDIVAPQDSGIGTGLRPYRNGLKRVFDIALILLALPAITVVIGLLALLVALDGGRPFYRQARIGRGGRIFQMWKLRTMVPDADQRLVAHLAADPEALAEWTCTQKLKCDPRITRAGRFLRKSSLDELPQLFNVLKGDMSLVGPRPMMLDQQSLYPGTSYYQLRPGMTGMWQVSDRNETAFAERAEYDARYDRTLSLWTDLRILAATVRVVLRGTGY